MLSIFLKAEGESGGSDIHNQQDTIGDEYTLKVFVLVIRKLRG